MSFALLWIEMLAVCLLWVAMLLACAGRLKASGYIFLAFFICFFPLINLLILAGASGFLKFGLEIRTNWFFYFCSLLVAFLAGMVFILTRASRPGELGTPRAAANWPRSRIALAFLTAVAIGGMTLWNMDLAARTEDEACRTEAGAMMLSVAPPVVSDDHNAAILYERAFARLYADPAGRKPLDDTTADASAPESVAFLERQTLTLKQLREAGAMPGCRFDHDYVHPSISLLLPELNTSRAGGLLLRLDARHELAKGHVSAAIDDINAAMQLSRHVGEEPILVCMLVSVALDKIAINTLEEALPSVTRKEEIASLSVGDVDAPQRMIRHAFVGEEAFGLLCFSDIAGERLTMRQISGDANATAIASRGPGPMMLRVFFLSDELQSYRECLEHYQKRPAAGYFPTYARVDVDNRADIINARAGFFSSLLVPALAKVMVQAGRSEAHRANATVAVAMTRYRLDHGSFPEKLALLVPDYLDEIPRDPFDGQPLRLTHTADQWTIYSIGPDGKDDGGKPFDEKTRTGDETFILKMPGAKPTTREAP